MTRYLDSISHPWSPSDIETAIFRDFGDAKNCIRETVGGTLWYALQDLEDSVWILDKNISDLFDEIALFSERSQSPSFWHGVNLELSELHAKAVKRKLFNCSASAMALVDHARNFQKIFPSPSYGEKLKENFNEYGLHDFIQGLRNYNTHWRIAEANWSISYSQSSSGRQVQFVVSKDELLAWSKWSLAAKKFIQDSNDPIDVKKLFFLYRKSINSFYSWHRGVVLREHAAEIRLYFYYNRIYEGVSKKNHWNIVLSHLPEKINPFQYISNYLPQHAVQKVLSMPYGSKEQVDAIIACMDMESFCDNVLLEKLYALFEVSN